MKIPVVLLSFLSFFTLETSAQTAVYAHSPDKKIRLSLNMLNGSPVYNISYAGTEFLGNSPLGLQSSIGDFSHDLRLTSQKTRKIAESYTLNRSKVSEVNYRANELTCSFVNQAKDTLSIVFRISDSDIAFNYLIHENGRGKVKCTIEHEVTGFKLPAGSTTFITPQAPASTGWEKTKPSYEEEYTIEEAVGKPSKYGLGYTYPALFHLGEKGWMLISETGVDADYVGTKLTEASSSGLYTVSFPEKGENGNVGPVTATATLPMQTSWKTITVGRDLKPIVETTSATDVVKPLTTSSKVFQTGRASWSWIVWQDESCNYNDQITYIDMAAALKFEFVLIDALWDVQIGRTKMEELISYAKSKNVGVLLWYNSNGKWNTAPQTPKNRMDTREARLEEMKWLQKVGVKGLKIDFFGGDKQATMKLYHDILMDASVYGLSINFHGTTLPRGWERMYPSFVTSEAVLASENLVFQQSFNDNYPVTATLYPFTRNAVAAMDFGPVFLNSRMDRFQKDGKIRRTTDAFEMATAVIFFSAVQHFGITPDNLKEKPGYLFDYLKSVPTVWDETRFIDGYPGKYCVIARRKGEKWYVAAINGESSEKILKVKLPMLKGKKVSIISDGQNASSAFSTAVLGSNADYEIKLAGNGGTVLYSF